MKKIGVLTSGGDAPGMNAAIRAVVRGGIFNGMEVYGINRGFEGLIDGDVTEMELGSVSDIIQRGGTFLKTSRSKRFMTDEGYRRALSVLGTFGIEGLVIVGGDGSLKGGIKLSNSGVSIMGLPGTIDNDLAYTEYSIGFDTAVNTAISAISNIRDTSSSHGRAIVVEVMGRRCGDIALYSGLAGGAESILIPEAEIDLNSICEKMLRGKRRNKLYSIIIKAEGVAIHSEALAKLLEERTGIETKVVVLGYLQRGGTPTGRDRILASRTAYRAIELLRDDSPSRAIGICGREIVDFDLEEALQMERPYDKQLIELASILSI